MFLPSYARECSSCDCHNHMPPGEHDTTRHPGLVEAIEDAQRQADEEELSRQRAEEERKRERARLAAELRAEESNVNNEREKLANRPHESSLRDLSEALQRQSRKALFTCGGRIMTNMEDAHNGASTDSSASQRQYQMVSSKPVSIRWGGDGQGRLLSLPINEYDCADQVAYKQLIADCVPATFGRNGQDVYDETYRRAGALGTEHFMTDFCPYRAGIIDSVAQLLLPPFTGDLRARPGTSVIANDKRSMARGLRAELYKLNVYSGPSGMFKPHVDTPRTSTQIGSLVVCLPTAFSGGELAIRHQGHEVIHNWSPPSPSRPGNETPTQTNHLPTPPTTVHWAAFYSDCEHEVLPVTTGHRLTLTYNLFLSPGTGLLTARPDLQKKENFTPQSLPLTQHLRKFLANPTAMPKGGFLGVNLVHAYPHTHQDLYAFVPNMLKGADMAIYESVAACRLPAALGPLLRLEDGLIEPHILRRLEGRTYIGELPVSGIETFFQASEIDKEPDSDDDNDGGDSDDMMSVS